MVCATAARPVSSQPSQRRCTTAGATSPATTNSPVITSLVGESTDGFASATTIRSTPIGSITGRRQLHGLSSRRHEVMVWMSRGASEGLFSDHDALRRTVVIAASIVARSRAVTLPVTTTIPVESARARAGAPSATATRVAIAAAFGVMPVMWLPSLIDHGFLRGGDGHWHDLLFAQAFVRETDPVSADTQLEMQRSLS